MDALTATNSFSILMTSAEIVHSVGKQDMMKKQGTLVRYFHIQFDFVAKLYVFE